MVAMGGHLGNKKKSRILFFLEKGPKKITIFGQKPGKIKKKSHSLLFLFPPACPPSIIFSSLISIHSFFICRNESNLSMKNKFYIKGSQFFFILNSHSIFFLFFCSEKPTKKNFSSFFIFYFFPHSFFSFSFINEWNKAYATWRSRLNIRIIFFRLNIYFSSKFVYLMT